MIGKELVTCVISSMPIYKLSTICRAFQGLNNIDNMSAEVQESTEEESYRRAIEQEKKIYTDSVTRLKELKPQIEHIRKVSSVL